MILVSLLVLATDIIPLAICVTTALLAWSRWRRGSTTVVPAAIAVLALAAMVWVTVAYIAGARTLLANPDPATKATILSLGLSEGINLIAFFLLVGAPLTLVAWLVDRRLGTKARVCGPRDLRGSQNHRLE